MKSRLILAVLLALPPVWLGGQSPAAGGPPEAGGLDPAAIRKPLSDSWPVYSGDYTGRRFSALKQVNHTTVRNLALAWVARMTAGSGGGGPNMIVGGEGTGEFNTGGAPNIKGSILMVDDVLYVTAPDNVWALDAHDGRVRWHYYWKTRGGTHIGNRGAALRYSTLYFETPDNYLVALDAKTGKEKWHVEIADFEQQYFSTTAPVIVDNHVIVGTGNDLDAPGFLQSYDADSGKLQWKLYVVPMNPGDPGLETWPNLDAARHGGGFPWVPGSYDPETRLYIFGTGNPTPGYTGVARPGDNLFTCSLVAVHVDTGKMAWYFQTSAHDTHDWDSAQTPILIDGVINGKPRKLVSTAARNGYFYTLDRVTGEHIVTSKYRHVRKLGQGDASDRRHVSRSRQGSDDPRIAGLARRKRSHQLAACRLLPRYRTVLRTGAQRLQHALPHGSGSARVDGSWRQVGLRPRIAWRFPHRDRLPHR